MFTKNTSQTHEQVEPKANQKVQVIMMHQLHYRWLLDGQKRQKAAPCVKPRYIPPVTVWLKNIIRMWENNEHSKDTVEIWQI